MEIRINPIYLLFKRISMIPKPGTAPEMAEDYSRDGNALNLMDLWVSVWCFDLFRFTRLIELWAQGLDYAIRQLPVTSSNN